MLLKTASDKIDLVRRPNARGSKARNQRRAIWATQIDFALHRALNVDGKAHTLSLPAMQNGVVTYDERSTSLLPGPDIVLACPHCEKPVRRVTFASGNNLGAVYWSDGKMVAPMWPDLVNVTRCPVCNEIFWVEEAKKLGQIDEYWKRSDPPDAAIRWEEAPRITHVDAGGLVSAIAATPPDRADRMQWLRIRLWHALNDPRRGTTQNRSPALEEALQELFLPNLEELVPLLDDNEPRERLMKAEALREMGRFEEALRLLLGIEAELESQARQIRALAMRRDALVAKLAPGDLRLMH
jgi:hypothetical protein